MRLNVTLYRVMAYLTGVVLIVLCLFAIAQVFTDDSAIVNVIGTIHGLLYIVYLIVSCTRSPAGCGCRCGPRSRYCWPARSR